MASPQAEAIKKLYRGWAAEFAARPDASIDFVREVFEHWGDVTTEPREVDYLEIDAGGVRALWCLPHKRADDRVVLCTHGGGYAAGSMFSHRKLYAHIAKAIGCRGLVLDFRRAPEFTHPAQVDDTVAAYAWLLQQGYKPEHICTTGDSAGGALSTSVLLAARAKGLPLPAAAMPISPWYDPEGTGATIQTNAGKDVLSDEKMVKSMGQVFVGDRSIRDPLANLLYSDPTGLPPLYIQVGGDELLLDDSLRFEKIARAAGVDVKLDVFPEMQHVWHFMAGAAPEADDAIARQAAWVRPKLGL